MAVLARVLKDPLLHFLVFGLIVFVFYETLNPASETQNDPRQFHKEWHGPTFGPN